MYILKSVSESSLHETSSSSKLFESRLSRLSEHFEASESILYIRSISLDFGLYSLLPSVHLCHYPCHLRSLLSSPDYPLIISIALSLWSFPHPSAISSVSSGCWPLHISSPPARHGLVSIANYRDRISDVGNAHY